MRLTLLCYALWAMPSLAASPESIERVASRRIFFGHQSVGGNLLDGVTDVSGGKLRVVQGRTPEALSTPGLVHTFIGQNEDPSGKVRDFEKALDEVQGKADLAFFKFCYIDFSANTDVEKLFAEYLASMERLHTKYAADTYVHVTEPLTIEQWARRLRARLKLSESDFSELAHLVQSQLNLSLSRILK